MTELVKQSGAARDGGTSRCIKVAVTGSGAGSLVAEYIRHTTDIAFEGEVYVSGVTLALMWRELLKTALLSGGFIDMFSGGGKTYCAFGQAVLPPSSGSTVTFPPLSYSKTGTSAFVVEDLSFGRPDNFGYYILPQGYGNSYHDYAFGTGLPASFASYRIPDFGVWNAISEVLRVQTEGSRRFGLEDINAYRNIDGQNRLACYSYVLYCLRTGDGKALNRGCSLCWRNTEDRRWFRVRQYAERRPQGLSSSLFEGRSTRGMTSSFGSSGGLWFLSIGAALDRLFRHWLVYEQFADNEEIQIGNGQAERDYGTFRNRNLFGSCFEHTIRTYLKKYWLIRSGFKNIPTDYGGRPQRPKPALVLVWTNAEPCPLRDIYESSSSEQAKRHRNVGRVMQEDLRSRFVGRCGNRALHCHNAVLEDHAIIVHGLLCRFFCYRFGNKSSEEQPNSNPSRSFHRVDESRSSFSSGGTRVVISSSSRLPGHNRSRWAVLESRKTWNRVAAVCFEGKFRVRHLPTGSFQRCTSSNHSGDLF